ncbi:DUF3927 family protein [Escherichia coli]|nr:DUF3927 family protein [Escherichia coli]
MKGVRIALAATLLFLVVAVDFTGRLMSMLADGVFVAGVVAVLWPLLRQKKETDNGYCLDCTGVCVAYCVSGRGGFCGRGAGVP